MALPNAYAQYNNSKILTASPSELTLMLYDGAIKFCNIAIQSIETRNIEQAHLNIIKAQRIITHFRQTLDMKYSVSEDFDRIYAYLEQRLFDANIKKEVAILQEVGPRISYFKHSVCSSANDSYYDNSTRRFCKPYLRKVF